MSYEKGQEIPLHPVDSVAVLKHGIVEVDYDEPCLRTKRYLKPGSIISHRRSRALAGTDVVIMVTKAGYALTEETETSRHSGFSRMEGQKHRLHRP
jgi:alkylhydroperoxidase family enzyme